MTSSIFPALAAALALAACNKAAPPPAEPKGVVPVSLHEAYQRLAGNPMKAFMEERQCGLLIHIRSEGEADHYVTWRIMSDGAEMLNFTATLNVIDAGHTKFDVTISKDPLGPEAYSETLIYRRPAIQTPARPAVEEQVEALLRGRPYDPAKAKVLDSSCIFQRQGLAIGSRFSVNDLKAEKRPNAYLSERPGLKKAEK